MNGTIKKLIISLFIIGSVAQTMPAQAFSFASLWSNRSTGEKVGMCATIAALFGAAACAVYSYWKKDKPKNRPQAHILPELASLVPVDVLEQFRQFQQRAEWERLDKRAQQLLTVPAQGAITTEDALKKWLRGNPPQVDGAWTHDVKIIIEFLSGNKALIQCLNSCEDVEKFCAVASQDMTALNDKRMSELQVAWKNNFVEIVKQPTKVYSDEDKAIRIYRLGFLQGKMNAHLDCKNNLQSPKFAALNTQLKGMASAMSSFLQKAVQQDRSGLEELSKKIAGQIAELQAIQFKVPENAPQVGAMIGYIKRNLAGLTQFYAELLQEKTIQPDWFKIFFKPGLFHGAIKMLTE